MSKVNADDLDWSELERGETHFKRKQLGEAANSEKLGCSLYEIPPGKRSWPYHYHAGNEEAIFVRSGSGSLRLDGETVSLAAGDYVALPADESGGHRVVNDSDAPLSYLAVSTMEEPDVTVYPDSGKVGVFAGSPPGGREERSVEGYYRREDDVDYWDGEEDE
ncbi:cupin domain-containing protein [Halorussus ruber]|uniref:cupin domain-containing protein n=1 Tax=Halorussus ruber TaxID=1126238 RepID=UPI0010923D0A|nr:cupin domain-containing protein [Halorussus ruber]